jgi:hypothetical protein
VEKLEQGDLGAIQVIRDGVEQDPLARFGGTCAAGAVPRGQKRPARKAAARSAAKAPERSQRRAANRRRRAGSVSARRVRTRCQTSRP